MSVPLHAGATHAPIDFSPRTLAAALKHLAVSGLKRGIGSVVAWQTRAAERQQLVGLDDRMLQDLGVTRADVWREARKPFWQA